MTTVARKIAPRTSFSRSKSLSDNMMQNLYLARAGGVEADSDDETTILIKAILPDGSRKTVNCSVYLS